ncbi:uncharacterized protein TNCV_1242171 [Trichonephila clavipes]|nr:uncharacterized protein TNCV_1242171 [Trichonephila clavipes]
MNLTRRNPPAHHWLAAKSPGISIQCRSSRAHQTALARLRSGHLRSMTFVQGSNGLGVGFPAPRGLETTTKSDTEK